MLTRLIRRDARAGNEIGAWSSEKDALSDLPLNVVGRGADHVLNALDHIVGYPEAVDVDVVELPRGLHVLSDTSGVFGLQS
jgi:hypothetical protein